MKAAGAATAALIVPGGILALLLMTVLADSEAAAACNPAAGSVQVDEATLPSEVHGYGSEQLGNAAIIIGAGADLGLEARDQAIGVMTAMGESGLRVIDHGDAAGPDSRGLFQQRDNGAWGTYEQRMDPHASATMFFQALAAIDSRESLAPTIAAHRVQRNADPQHYASYWPAAVAVVEALSGANTQLVGSDGDDVCSAAGAAVPGDVSPDGWAAPAAGPITSGFGGRVDPVTGGYTMFHAGLDLAGGGCDGPIWAVQDGVVSAVHADDHGGWMVDIEHGGTVMSRYKHMHPDGIRVQAGEPVQSGQNIARVGSSGWSTGCHLHFEIHLNGDRIEPQAFLTERGVSIG